MIINIKLNKEVYDQFKSMKIIEAQLLRLCSDQIDSEKKFYIDKLKQALVELNSKKERIHNETIDELESIINQKERLKVALAYFTYWFKWKDRISLSTTKHEDILWIRNPL